MIELARDPLGSGSAREGRRVLSNCALPLTSLRVNFEV